MARLLYSVRFIAVQGLNGDSYDVTVPVGHVYVVKQLTAYSNPTLGPWAANFHCVTTGETRFSAGGPDGAREWEGFYGALVFEEGETFRWTSYVTPTDGVDVYAGGYDLLSP